MNGVVLRPRRISGGNRSPWTRSSMSRRSSGPTCARTFSDVEGNRQRVRFSPPNRTLRSPRGIQRCCHASDPIYGFENTISKWWVPRNVRRSTWVATSRRGECPGPYGARALRNRHVARRSQQRLGAGLVLAGGTLSRSRIPWNRIGGPAYVPGARISACRAFPNIAEGTACWL
jgi:hypothetical protein